MASLSLCPQFETNLMSNRKVIKLLLQLKSAKAHCKNYIKSNHTWSAIFCVIVYFEKSKSYVLTIKLRTASMCKAVGRGTASTAIT